MQTVRQLLDNKKQHAGPIAIAPEATVFQALELMAEHDIGAVLVMEGKNVVGIFSERDYARRIILQGRTSTGTPVRDIMTSRVLFVRPENTVDDCMALMSEKRIRHLPVLDEGGEVCGVLSIGDLVRATIEEQEHVIGQLVQYIHG
ncbi:MULTISPECIES: CBS domain-containing protein [Gulbenkiania]|uniref:CBS domain n=2 Tax=Gulbenkiania TaxID=397456 RepID=A0A0K6H2V2_9NEIS|nr:MULTISPECIES: CBS domain-containing protein [Gulbenkiania]TCW33496.1 CBS domain protein [Gulbenkiania mobilis]CUA85313.1 CBS domain [Gulbenkiania indica]